MGVCLERVNDVQKFDYVEATLAVLVLRYERLRLRQASRQFLLCKSGPFPGLNKNA
jgi:hypothetical protein